MSLRCTSTDNIAEYSNTRPQKDHSSDFKSLDLIDFTQLVNDSRFSTNRLKFLIVTDSNFCTSVYTVQFKNLFVLYNMGPVGKVLHGDMGEAPV